MKKRAYIILLIFLIIVFWWIIIAQTTTTNKLYRWYQAVSSTTKWVINTWWAAINSTIDRVFEHNLCKKVINTSSIAIFVPTKTDLERYQFRTNLPPNTSLASCGCYENFDCPSGQFCQWATSAGSPYCAWFYQWVDYYCRWKPIPQSSTPYVCMKDYSPYQLVPADWCPSGRTLWFIQWWTIFPSYETLCQYSNQDYFEFPNCEYKCEPYTTQTNCQANSSYCSRSSRNIPLSCSSLTTQTTCQSKSGCTRNSWWTPIPWTCVVQTCWSAHGQTYSSLSSTNSNLCNGWSATNFVTNTSNWTWKCGTASCSANKQTTNQCWGWFYYTTWSICDQLPAVCIIDDPMSAWCCCPLEPIERDPTCWSCPSDYPNGGVCPGDCSSNSSCLFVWPEEHCCCYKNTWGGGFGF